MFHTCDHCNEIGHEDEGMLYEGFFECGTCYGRRIDAEFAAMQDFAAINRNYPNLYHHTEMMKSDPVGFYLACKTATLDI